ncbi:MAG: hypothetical protein RIR66_161 [Actinomycetota bacterium]
MLVFGIGLGIIALLVLTTAVNIATLWVTKSKLNSVADSVAIAASHSIDVENFYSSGFNQKIVLNESLAKARAQNFLERLSIQTELKSFKLLDVDVEQDSVTVFISADPQLPFGYLIPGVNPQIQSSAKALIKTG